MYPFHAVILPLLFRYRAELLVEGCVIVELKVSQSYNKDDEPQLLNELKAIGIKVRLRINFVGDKVEFKRFVF